jgi:hypothetical protein
MSSVVSGGTRTAQLESDLQDQVDVSRCVA